MYTLQEIKTIFTNCKTFDDLTQVCQAFTYLIRTESVSSLKIFQIRLESNIKFRQLEKL